MMRGIAFLVLAWTCAACSGSVLDVPDGPLPDAGPPRIDLWLEHPGGGRVELFPSLQPEVVQRTYVDDANQIHVVAIVGPEGSHLFTEDQQVELRAVTPDGTMADLVLQSAFAPGADVDFVVPFCQFFEPEGNRITIHVRVVTPFGRIVVDRSHDFVFGCANAPPEVCATFCP